MTVTLIDKDGWDIIVEGDYFYFMRMDAFGKNKTYHKSNIEKIEDISEVDFCRAKYGDDYMKFLHLLDTNDDYCVKLKDGTRICSGFRDYFFYFVDQNGNIINKRDDIGFDNIYSFDLDKYGNIWFAIPLANYIGQFSLEKGEEIYHLGEKYKDNAPFNLPEEIKIYDDFAYICDTGNRRICKLHIDSKETTEHLKFNKPTWEYRQYKEYEIIRLEDGIYVIG